MPIKQRQDIDLLNIYFTAKIIKRGCYKDGPMKNWTATYVPDECRDEENGIQACYCTSDLCNGQQYLLANSAFVLLVLAISVIFIK